MSRTATSVLGSTVFTSLLLTSLAFAQVGTTAVIPTSSTGTTSNTVAAPAPQKGAVNGECVATAVGVREDALIAAHSAQNTAIGTALTARKADLQAAWKMASNKERRVAREAAWKKFREARSAANKTMKTSVNAAYAAFNTAAKACGVQYREMPEGGATVSL